MSQPAAVGATAGPSVRPPAPALQSEPPPPAIQALAGLKRKSPSQPKGAPECVARRPSKPSIIRVDGRPGDQVVVDVDGWCFDSKKAQPRLEIHAPAGVIVRASPPAPLLLPPVVKYFGADGAQVGADAELSGAFAFCVPADHRSDAPQLLHEFQREVVNLDLNHKAKGRQGPIMCRNLAQRYVCDRRPWADGKQVEDGPARLLSVEYRTPDAIKAHVDQSAMVKEAERLARQRDFVDTFFLGFSTFGDDLSKSLKALGSGDRRLGVLINQRHSMAIELERGIALQGGQERSAYRVRLYDPYRTRTLLEVMVNDPGELQGRTFSRCIGTYAPGDYESGAAPRLDDGAFALLPWPPLDEEQALHQARQAVLADPWVGREAWLTIPGHEPVRVRVESGTRQLGVMFCTMESMEPAVLNLYAALSGNRAEQAGLPKALLTAAKGWRLIVPRSALTALE